VNSTNKKKKVKKEVLEENYSLLTRLEGRSGGYEDLFDRVGIKKDKTIDWVSTYGSTMIDTLEAYVQPQK
jgi:hypothetical protein